MKLKQFMSGLLAATMALAMVVPTFAAGSDRNQTTEIGGTVSNPTVDITVPGTASVILNVNHRQLQANGFENTKASFVPTSSMTIKNNATDCSVKLNLTLTASVPNTSTVQFATTDWNIWTGDPAVDTAATTAPASKQVFMKAYIKVDAIEDDSKWETARSTIAAARIADINDGTTTEPTGYVVSTTAQTIRNVATLQQKDTGKTNAAHIILNGSIVENPTKANPSTGATEDDDWDVTNDTITLTFAFTAIPAAAA